MARPKELLPMKTLQENLPALVLLQSLIVDALADTAAAKDTTTEYRLARYEILSTFQRKVSGAVSNFSQPDSRPQPAMPPLL